MTAEQLARALKGVRSGRQWVCRCVAHEDRAPSMIIFDGVTAVQVRCMAGCATADIIDELKRRGLWDGLSQNNPKPQPVSDLKPERDRTQIAQWLWSQRQPIDGTAAGYYLRHVRGISCPLPPTLGYLPKRDDHPHALIAAFGFACESDAGVLSLLASQVRAVHLTKLTPDVRKIEKIMVGSPRGVPIVLSPINDLLGLAICEGIEEGLSWFEATGLGVWAAGSASLMSALGDEVPDWLDCVTVVTDVADTKGVGLHHASKLANQLLDRGVHAEMVPSRGGAFA